MTYCVGCQVDEGLVFLSDSRTNAGVDQVSTFRKMTFFQMPGERVIVLLSAGNLAVSQSVTGLLRERVTSAKASLLTTKTMFDAPRIVAGKGSQLDRPGFAGFRREGSPVDPIKIRLNPNPETLAPTPEVRPCP